MAFKLGAFLGGAADAISKGIEENEKRVQLLTDRALDYHTKLRLDAREDYKDRRRVVEEELNKIRGVLGSDELTKRLVDYTGSPTAALASVNSMGTEGLRAFRELENIEADPNAPNVDFGSIVDYYTPAEEDVTGMAESLIPQTEQSFLFGTGQDALTRFRSSVRRQPGLEGFDNASKEYIKSNLKNPDLFKYITSPVTDPGNAGVAMISAGREIAEQSPEKGYQLILRGRAYLADAEAMSRGDDGDYEGYTTTSALTVSEDIAESVAGKLELERDFKPDGTPFYPEESQRIFSAIKFHVDDAITKFNPYSKLYNINPIDITNLVRNAAYNNYAIEINELYEEGQPISMLFQIDKERSFFPSSLGLGLRPPEETEGAGGGGGQGGADNTGTGMGTEGDQTTDGTVSQTDKLVQEYEQARLSGNANEARVVRTRLITHLSISNPEMETADIIAEVDKLLGTTG